MSANKHESFLEDDGNVLQLDGGDDYTTLYIY